MKKEELMKLTKSELANKLISQQANRQFLSDKYLTLKADFILIKRQLSNIVDNIVLPPKGQRFRQIVYYKGGNFNKKSYDGGQPSETLRREGCKKRYNLQQAKK